ncbi:hypothetical protein [Synechococcus phage S-N03]|uniref:Uncharacterized protein n=1 Tax=Synechococcus phage S-N03 TaxID=2718943 RepID=A0A6G8R6C8_9CAUD|nr:hypothetical protein PQC09_gp073 [Synechococcus phage S-N03]QIN96708.1 hypothetical protein [Synechococcus phage S-N03]
MSFGYADAPVELPDRLEMTFEGEELDLVMEAFRAAVPVDDPLGEKIMLRYLSTKVALQEKEEEEKPKYGFIK